MVDTSYFAETLIVTAQNFRYILKTLKILGPLGKKHSYTPDYTDLVLVKYTDTDY